MQDYFDNEIKHLTRELTALKTSMVKSSGSILSVSKSYNFSIPLQSSGFLRPSGLTKFILHTDNNALFHVTLDSYYDDVMKQLDGRYLTRQKYPMVARRFGNIRIDVRGLGTKDDETTIQGGGSVTLTGVMTIQCTNEFTLEAIE